MGSEARGLSASTVSCLKQTWANEYKSWQQEPLDRDRLTYLWVDGRHSSLRAEDAKRSALVVVGVNERGEKRFLAIEDGVRESTQNWREGLLGLKRRRLQIPKLAIGRGALSFWAAVEEVFPNTRAQRCPRRQP